MNSTRRDARSLRTDWKHLRQDERSDYNGGLVSHLDAKRSTAACRIAMENPPMKRGTQQTLVVFTAVLPLAMSMANIYAEDSLPPLNGRSGTHQSRRDVAGI